MPAVKESATVPAGNCVDRDEKSALETLGRSIAMLSVAHQYRDRFTVQHQHRTAELSAAIGVELGLASLNVEILRLAASVHDVGKIAVPAEMLFKSDALTDAEYAVIKTHSAIGKDILLRLQTSFAVAEIVAQHHERLDGSGYPRGLRAMEILPEARILAVADVFDAMTSKRPYRDGLPLDFVLGELRSMAGRLLDADAVAACITCALHRAVAPATDSPAARA